MSMLSAQCDELRTLADDFQLTIDKGWDAREEATRAVPLLLEAADTILSLRDRAQELQGENAKLLGLLQRAWDVFHGATAREFVEVKNELRELGIEVDA